jgi:hypothetical protein
MGLTEDLDHINTITGTINNLQDSIDTKNVYNDQQLQEINNKKNLLITRKRMLEVSKERNDYKRKIIYILLSIILALLLLLLSYYMYEIGKKNNN